MIYEFLVHLKDKPDYAEMIAESYKYIMVDECQDMNRVQYEILQILEKSHHNLFLVGDQDQTVYEWRGSDPRLMKEFIDTYNPVVLPLLNNYRCDGYGVEVGNRVIANNKLRIKKELKAMKPKRNKPKIYGYMYAMEEANAVVRMIKDFINQGYQPRDIKVLYRQNK